MADSADRMFRILRQGDRGFCRRFDELRVPRSIPWSRVMHHEAQALANHDQTLGRLSERGGLDPVELWLVVTGQKLFPLCQTTTLEHAVAELRKLGVFDEVTLP